MIQSEAYRTGFRDAVCSGLSTRTRIGAQVRYWHSARYCTLSFEGHCCRNSVLGLKGQNGQSVERRAGLPAQRPCSKATTIPTQQLRTFIEDAS